MPHLFLSLSPSPQNTQGAAANGVSPLAALAWTGERRVKKQKKQKLLADAMAKAKAKAAAAATTTTTAAAATPPASTPTSSSAQLAASVYGEGARASVEQLRRERAIRLEDVQNLVLWVLGEGASPRWAFVKVREERGRGSRRRRRAALVALSLTNSLFLFQSFAPLDRTRP